jgi:hypothetical protein
MKMESPSSMSARSDAFVTLSPNGIGRFPVERFPTPQRIDYARQPAYADFVAQAPLATRLRATGRFLRSLVPLAAKRVTNYELIPNEVRMDKKSLSGRLRLGAAGLRNAFARTRRSSRIESGLAHRLAEDGCVVIACSAEAIAGVEAAVAPAYAKLQRTRAELAGGKRDFLDSRYHADRRDEMALYRAVDTLLRDAQVMRAASEYLGREASLVDVNPQINDPSDSFWREIFPDRELSGLPKTAYFHRDASGGDLKAIIYMSEVGSSNGPFTFVLGSHKLPIGRLDNFICEANDSNGLNDTSAEMRRIFAALPHRLRQKGSFGNDVPDDDPVSDEIVGAAWPITGPKGAVVLFDTKGIHRGGMVEDGERHVITCVLG